MICIGEEDFRAERFERFLGQAFDRGLSAHGKEHGRLDGAVRGGQAAAASTGPVRLRNFKRKTHPLSVAACSFTGLPTPLWPRPILPIAQTLRKRLFPA